MHPTKRLSRCAFRLLGRGQVQSLRRSTTFASSIGEAQSSLSFRMMRPRPRQQAVNALPIAGRDGLRLVDADTKGEQPKHYSIAHGSANEVKGALETAIAWGWIQDASEPLGHLDRLLALLWRLTHPRV